MLRFHTREWGQNLRATYTNRPEVASQCPDDKDPDEPQKEHRHLISLNRRESVPEYTRRGLSA